MAFDAKLIKHSAAPNGVEVVTGELTYPFLVHQDIWTHRTLWKTSSEQFEKWLDASRSSSSNRAIPSERLIASVRADPFIPLAFKQRAKTMQAGVELEPRQQQRAQIEWINGSRRAADLAEELTRLGVHKQWANRPMGPYQWITTVATANRQWWDHFLYLRAHEAAQDEVQTIAFMFKELLEKSAPDQLALGDWHLPYVSFDEVMTFEEFDFSLHGDPFWTVRRLSAARCARTSYLRQGEMFETRDDLRLYDDLVKYNPPHDAPREHVLTPLPSADTWCGNFVGWETLRARESTI